MNRSLPADKLRDMAVLSLERRGAPSDKAQLQADRLIKAELRGLPSHRLQRRPRLLVRIDRGLAAPRAKGAKFWIKQGFLTMDGQRGLGPVVVVGAMRELEDAVAACGIAVAAIRNANHIGMLAYYADAAATAGLIGIVISTSEALVHPHGGTQAMLGTSIVSMGKIHNHALRGDPIPAGWAVDAAGRSTTDPEAAKSGAIAPVGGAKGHGLGLAIEFFVAMLSGSNVAPDVRDTLDDTHPATKGDVLILIDPTAGSGDAVTLAAYLDRLRSSRPADPERPAAIPGDGSRARRDRAQSSGIHVPDALLDTLSALAAA